MTLETLKQALPEVAKDIRLNLSTVLSEEGASDLTSEQILGIALACAYATRSKVLITHVKTMVESLEPKVKEAAKAAAIIMGMNNIYYRFVHLVEKEEFSTLPAKLRMNIMANPGVSHIDFELMSLAVSAINGCGMCMVSHTSTLTKAGVSTLGIQSAIRIASVIHATAIALEVE